MRKNTHSTKSLYVTSYNPQARSGFTLIELLIYIAIIGLVATSFVSFSITITDSRNKNYVEQEVQANARVALDIISRSIRAATGVNGGASTFDVNPGVLSLSMADVSKNPTVISLNPSNGALQVTEGTAGSVVITSNEVKVTNLIFRNVTGTSARENIRAELTVEYNTTGSDVAYAYAQSLTTSVSLRQ